jgi:O-antigen/teichoic acid export membrane protein
MAQAARIRRNSFFAFLSQLIRLGTNFLMFVGIARLYGVEAFGQFTTAHTLATIFLLLADFGFDMLVATEIARNRAQSVEVARRYFSQKVLFASVATVGMFAISFMQNFTWQTRVLVQVLALYTLAGSLNNFFFALFKGFEEFHHETRISLWTNGCLLVLLVVLGVLHLPLETIAAAFVLTRLAGVALASKVAARLAGGGVMRLTFDRWRETWRPVAVFGVHFIFGNLFFTLDTILLSFWKGDREVGIYQAAFKVVTLSLVLPDIGVNTMMPVLARLHGEGDERWAAFGKLLSKALFLIALPVSLVLLVYADQIVAILYGSGQFVEAVPILRLFAFTVFIRFVVDSYGIMLTTSRRQGVRMVIVVAGTVLNLAFNAFMIPRYGPWGAAEVSLVTNLLVGAGYVVASRQPFLRWTGEARNLASLAIIVCIGILAWNFRTVPVWFTAPLVVGACGAVLYFVGFSRDDWKTIMARGEVLSPLQEEVQR